MKKLFIILIFSLTSLATFAADPQLIAWIAARVGDKMYTNLDVESFVTRSELSDMEKTVLFKRANKDHGKYLQLKRQKIYENDRAVYNKALKKLIYQEMVKQHAMRDMRRASSRSSRNSGGPLGLGNLFGGGSRNSSAPVQRRAFNITEEAFYKMVQEKEDKVLKTWLDQRLGIVVARQKFGEELKNADYPHKSSDSHEDIYWKWYKSMKNALKQDILSNEVKKWEAIQGTKRNPTMHIRPIDVRDFYTETSSLIEEKVQNQDMSYKTWTNLIASNPEISVMMEKTKILSLGGASPFSISNEDPAKFESLKKEINDNFSPQLSDSLINKIIDYEAKAAVLASKYQSVEKLMELYTSHDRRTDDKSLMLAKLYKMAASIKEGKADRELTRNLLTTILKKAFSDLKTSLAGNSMYVAEEYKKHLFHMIVEAELKKLTNDQIDKDDIYSKRAFNMGIWFTKFIANKTAFSTNVRIKTSICDYGTFECQKKIQDWLKMEEFQSGIDQFRQRDLRNEHRGMVSINPDGRTNLYGQDALDFILN
ncbi:MAG: hypothetical protein KC493_10250 [Bacteriovoracaceae bacterium]|nr:hypothetical protein [Bacteriovoracaceae bacterium]